MKTLFDAFKTTLLVGMFVTSSLLTGCQSDANQDRELVENQWIGSNGKPIINYGKVQIKVQPFGSIQATIFQGQIPAYTFSVDREKPQNLLTGDIDNATIYLTCVGEHRDALVIDDQQTQKRYVLCYYDISDRLKDLPTTQSQTVFIKGYSTGLQRLSPAIALNSKFN